MKKIVILFIAFAFALSLSACDGEDDSIKFGVIGPLTGDYDLYGVAVRNGAELAAAEINEAGGVLGQTLEIIAYDSKGDAAEGTNAYNRLVDQDGIDALIGGTFSGVTLGIKSLAIEDGLPVLTPTATNPDVTLNAPNVFRACYTDSYQGQVAAVFAADSLEATNVAVLFNRDDAYSEGLANAFMEQFDKDNTLSYTAFEFGAQDDDYSTQLTSIKNGSYDAVFVPAYVAEVGPILTQAATLDLEMPFIGGDGWDGIEAQYAEVAEGNYFANHYAKTDEAQVVQDFVANYEATYGEAPNALAALAYDAAYALAQAFEDAGSAENSEVVAALADLNFTDAVTGSITFNADGDPIKAITMIKIVEGEQTVETKVEAT